jgi:hypothetical protein
MPYNNNEIWTIYMTWQTPFEIDWTKVRESSVL